jgi:hypothetical protein
VLQDQRVDVAPALLDPDPSTDVDERQVVVEDVSAEGDLDDVPGGESAAEDEEPRETDEADSGQRLAVEPSQLDWLAPLCQWYGLSRLWPDVLGLRADEAVVGALLQNVGGPAGCAGHRKRGRKVLLGQADGL